MAYELSDEDDDPIRLIDFEQYRFADYNGIGLNKTEEEIIDVDAEDENLFLNTSYKNSTLHKVPNTLLVKKLPQNVNVLHGCIPMSIKIVDIKKFPSYHRNRLQKLVLNDDFGLDCTNSIKRGKDYTKSKKSKTKIAPVTSYNSIQRMANVDPGWAQIMKNKALSQRNTTKMDLKKNQGLVGLRIVTDISLDESEIIDKCKKMSTNESDTNLTGGPAKDTVTKVEFDSAFKIVNIGSSKSVNRKTRNDEKLDEIAKKSHEEDEHKVNSNKKIKSCEVDKHVKKTTASDVNKKDNLITNLGKVDSKTKKTERKDWSITSVDINTNKMKLLRKDPTQINQIAHTDSNAISNENKTTMLKQICEPENFVQIAKKIKEKIVSQCCTSQLKSKESKLKSDDKKNPISKSSNNERQTEKSSKEKNSVTKQKKLFTKNEMLKTTPKVYKRGIKVSKQITKSGDCKSVSITKQVNELTPVLPHNASAVKPFTSPKTVAQPANAIKPPDSQDKPLKGAHTSQNFLQRRNVSENEKINFDHSCNQKNPVGYQSNMVSFASSNHTSSVSTRADFGKAPSTLTDWRLTNTVKYSPSISQRISNNTSNKTEVPPIAIATKTPETQTAIRKSKTKPNILRYCKEAVKNPNYCDLTRPLMSHEIAHGAQGLTKSNRSTASTLNEIKTIGTYPKVLNGTDSLSKPEAAYPYCKPIHTLITIRPKPALKPSDVQSNDAPQLYCQENMLPQDFEQQQIPQNSLLSQPNTQAYLCLPKNTKRPQIILSKNNLKIIHPNNTSQTALHNPTNQQVHVTIRQRPPPPPNSQQPFKYGDPNYFTIRAPSQPTAHEAMQQLYVHSYQQNMQAFPPMGPQQYAQNYTLPLNLPEQPSQAKVPQQFVGPARQFYDTLPDNLPFNQMAYIPSSNFDNFCFPPPPPPPFQPPTSHNQFSSQTSVYTNTALPQNQENPPCSIIGLNGSGPVRKINLLPVPQDMPQNTVPNEALENSIVPKDKLDIKPVITKHEMFDEYCKATDVIDTSDKMPAVDHFKMPSHTITTPDKTNVQSTTEASKTSTNNNLNVQSNVVLLNKEEPISKAPCDPRKTHRPTIIEDRKQKPGPLSKKPKMDSSQHELQHSSSRNSDKVYTSPTFPVFVKKSGIDNNHIGKLQSKKDFKNEHSVKTVDYSQNPQDQESSSKANINVHNNKKKISLKEYKKRVVLDAEPKEGKKFNKQNIVSVKRDSTDQDLGYDSDATLKL